jgi:hypothetical protein
MKPPDSFDLLQQLDSMGTASLERLVLLQTGSTKPLFNSLEKLLKLDFVEIHGNKSEVNKFIKAAQELNSDDPSAQKEQLMTLLEENVEVSKCYLTLTKKGFNKSLKSESALF